MWSMLLRDEAVFFRLSWTIFLASLAKRRQRPIEANESRQWFHAVQQAHLLCPPGVELVPVCDREADISDMCQDVQERGAKMLIRASQNRAVLDDP